MKFLKVLAVASLFASTAMATDLDSAATDVQMIVEEYIQSPEIVAAINAQNMKHANLDDEQIMDLDRQWRAETESADQPLITATLENDVSKQLQTLREEHAGTYSEIFVMDNKGLNVGQSDPTSDYWQGDEAKFQKSYGEESGLFVDEVEFDESSQTYSVQISSAVTDPATGERIGAVTFGVIVE